jgi:hypothetical protein
MPLPLRAASPSAPLSPHERLNALLENAGVSKTVYSYVMPETEAAFEEILDSDREGLRAMYREAWTQKQDGMHEEFFAAWKDWSAPVVKFSAAEFPWFYTTGGASEALRETIYAYGLAARAAGFEPVIHVFDGDYEGFSAYALAAGIRTVSHNRARWRETLSGIGPRHQVYLSQPSALDGNVWAEYGAFIDALYRAQPRAEVMLDLTYVGCVARRFEVDARSPNIRTIFFSLSKPMGVYYHRIGGLFSRDAYPGLFGHKWFKNLLSLRLGTRMMQKFGVHELPSRYARLGQAPALAAAQKKLGLRLVPSDVCLLATAAPSPQPSELERYLLRGGKGAERLRLCLTPTIASIINPHVDGRVKARAHEGIGGTP